MHNCGFASLVCNPISPQVTGLPYWQNQRVYLFLIYYLGKMTVCSSSPWISSLRSRWQASLQFSASTSLWPVLSAPTPVVSQHSCVSALSFWENTEEQDWPPPCPAPPQRCDLPEGLTPSEVPYVCISEGQACEGSLVIFGPGAGRPWVLPHILCDLDQVF